MPVAMVKHILVKTREEAELINKRLLKGEDFGKLAKAISTCNTAKKGGDLGEVRPGQMVKSIDSVIFKKTVDKVHGPVKPRKSS